MVSPDSADLPELVELCEAYGEIDAQLIRALLQSHGIASSFSGESLRLTHAFTLNKLGKVRILVRPEDEELARQVLEEASQQ